jgi:hypothetical protein
MLENEKKLIGSCFLRCMLQARIDCLKRSNLGLLILRQVHLRTIKLRLESADTLLTPLIIVTLLLDLIFQL